MVKRRQGPLRRVYEVAQLCEGDIFGEMAILLDAPANASVVGVGNVNDSGIRRYLSCNACGQDLWIYRHDTGHRDLRVTCGDFGDGFR